MLQDLDQILLILLEQICPELLKTLDLLHLDEQILASFGLKLLFYYNELVQEIQMPFSILWYRIQALNEKT